MAVRRQSNDDRVDIGDRLAAIASYRNRAGKLDGARRGQRLSLGQFTRANTRWRPKDRVMTRFREESRHANRYIQLEKRPEVVDEIYRRGLDADLPDFEQALFNFGADLTAHPDNVGVYQFYHLREIGLDDLEILDLIHSIAIFGWANRLMHTLGEPHLKA